MEPLLRWLLTAAVTFGCEEASQQAIQKEQELLRGTWTVVGVEREGKSLPAACFEGERVAFEGERILFLKGDSRKHSAISEMLRRTELGPFQFIPLGDSPDDAEPPKVDKAPKEGATALNPFQSPKGMNVRLLAFREQDKPMAGEGIRVAFNWYGPAHAGTYRLESDRLTLSLEDAVDFAPEDPFGPIHRKKAWTLTLQRRGRE